VNRQFGVKKLLRVVLGGPPMHKSRDTAHAQ